MTFIGNRILKGHMIIVSCMQTAQSGKALREPLVLIWLKSPSVRSGVLMGYPAPILCKRRYCMRHLHLMTRSLSLISKWSRIIKLSPSFTSRIIICGLTAKILCPFLLVRPWRIMQCALASFATLCRPQRPRQMWMSISLSLTFALLGGSFITIVSGRGQRICFWHSWRTRSLMSSMLSCAKVLGSQLAWGRTMRPNRPCLHTPRRQIPLCFKNSITDSSLAQAKLFPFANLKKCAMDFVVFNSFFLSEKSSYHSCRRLLSFDLHQWHS